jgi:hypothetical protein
VLLSYTVFVAGFWLSPNIQPVSTMTTMKPLRKKKVTKAGKPPGKYTGIFKILGNGSFYQSIFILLGWVFHFEHLFCEKHEYYLKRKI